ncbi:hypothetical protein [Aquirhabdus sp.]|uniref:hypothetical protein n=1 Tax=Aquirhabdus sp. TaxID=2824160 RepID=UPI00396C4D1A
MIILCAGLLLIVAILSGVYAGWWVLNNADARLTLTDQAAQVMIPNAVPVKADILTDLDVMLNGSITTTVPIDQTVQVPIHDTLHVIATLDNDVPIKMNVPIHDIVPVDQIVHVDSKVDVMVLGRTLKLPIRGDVPIKAQVPINLDVPVDQMVHLKFTAPADVKLLQALSVPLKTDIKTTIPLHSAMKIPVRSSLLANVSITDPLDAIVTHADLRLPLSTLKLNFGNAHHRSAQNIAASVQPKGQVQ